MTHKRAGWFVFVIAAATALAIAFIVPLVGQTGSINGKGGPGPNLLSSKLLSVLVWVGVVGLLVGLAGMARSRPSWRRLSGVSVVCAGLALLLEVLYPWWPGFSAGYAGIWLGGVLGLVACGAAIGTFIRPMQNKLLDIPLAIVGLLVGAVCALFAIWILLLTVGGGGD